MPRGGGVDRVDQRVTVRRAQHDTVQATRNGDVVNIAPLAGQKPRVFEAAQRPPDLPVRHVMTSPRRSSRQDVTVGIDGVVRRES